MKKHKPFHFKQFTVRHDKAAMKIGTDGVLLAVWIKANQPKKVLDIGTGTGVTSLIMAQRFKNAKIIGIDIDVDAFVQTQENITSSSFSDRIISYWSDILEFNSHEKFDLIISNPPFFLDSQQAESYQRTTARHVTNFNPVQFFKKSHQLLSKNGVLNIIIPYQDKETWLNFALDAGLYARRKCIVYGSFEKVNPKRLLIEFSKVQLECNNEEICIGEANKNRFTKEFEALAKDFYTIF